MKIFLHLTRWKKLFCAFARSPEESSSSNSIRTTPNSTDQNFFSIDQNIVQLLYFLSILQSSKFWVVFLITASFKARLKTYFLTSISRNLTNWLVLFVIFGIVSTCFYVTRNENQFYSETSSSTKISGVNFSNSLSDVCLRVSGRTLLQDAVSLVSGPTFFRDLKKIKKYLKVQGFSFNNNPRFIEFLSLTSRKTALHLDHLCKIKLFFLHYFWK